MTKQKLMELIKYCEDDAEIKIIVGYDEAQLTNIDTSESNEILIECELDDN